MVELHLEENVCLDTPKQDEKDQEKLNKESKKSAFQKCAENNSVGGLS